MDHNLTYEKGTHPRNHMVICSCGWRASDTYLMVRKRGEHHQGTNNPLRWDDPERAKQPDREFPDYRFNFGKRK